MIVEDRNTNTTGAQLTGITTKRVGSKLSSIAKSISDGRVKTLIVFGEDVTKYGIDSKLLKKVTLIVSDILPNETTKLADYLLPGCAHAEKRGMTASAFATLWVLNNSIVTSVLAGPRTMVHWNGYLDALNYTFSAEDEALVDKLVAPGHPSTPGYNDPQYGIEGRPARTS